MFLPMIGRRSVFTNPRPRTSVFADKDFCEADPEIPIWMKKATLRALDFFLRLENCSRLPNPKLCKQKEVASEKSSLDTLQDETEHFVIEHLLRGTAKISKAEF